MTPPLDRRTPAVRPASPPGRGSPQPGWPRGPAACHRRPGGAAPATGGRTRHRRHLHGPVVHRPRRARTTSASRRRAPSTPTSTSPTRPAGPPRCRRSSRPTASAAARPTRPGSGRAFAQRGYAVLSYTGLGFPDSGCKISLDDPGVDGVAARSLVTFLGGGSSAAYDSADLGGVPVGPGTLTVDFTRLDDAATPRPPGRHDRRLLRRPDPVRHRGSRRPRRHAGAADHLERPALLAGPQQHEPHRPARRTPTPTRARRRSAGPACSSASASPTASPAPRSTRPATSAAPTSSSRRARPRRRSTRLGYPTADTYRLTDRVSVAHYLDRVTVPTFLIQGENDTLFNLQEAAATYRGLKARGVPGVDGLAVVGPLGRGQRAQRRRARRARPDRCQDIEGTYLGQRIKNWFDHHLKGSKADSGPEFAYFRDWVTYTGSAAPAYATADSYPVGTRQTWYLSAADELVRSRGRGPAGRRRAGPTRAAGAFASYSEVSGLEGAGRPARAAVTARLRHPGHLRRLDDPGPAVGHDHRGRPHPRRAVRVAGGGRDPEPRGRPGQLQVFAKMYDVAPDGTQTLGAQADQPRAGRRRDPAGAHRAARRSCTGSRRVTASGWSWPAPTRPTRTRMPCSRSPCAPTPSRPRPSPCPSA